MLHPVHERNDITSGLEQSAAMWASIARANQSGFGAISMPCSRDNDPWSNFVVFPVLVEHCL